MTTHVPNPAMPDPATPALTPAKVPGRRRRANDFEAALAPFRLDPPPADLAPEIVLAGNLGFSIAADMLGLHKTCPRRECRRTCAAGLQHTCEAEFPAMALHMVLGMQLFLLEIPYETALALHAIRRGEASATRDPSEPAASAGVDFDFGTDTGAGLFDSDNS